MRLDVRSIRSPKAEELYITAVPEAGADPASEARAMFAAVADALRCSSATPCRQRAFVPTGCFGAYLDAFAASFKGPDAHLPTAWLSAGAAAAAGGAVGGIQLHAIGGVREWKPLAHDGAVLGWSFAENGHRWAVTGGLCAPGAGDAPQQARRLFEAGEALIGQAGMDLKCVARTWFFLDDILSWYGPFNAVRNELFVERGLLWRGQAPGTAEVPASTGMGVTPVPPEPGGGAARVALELFAVKGPDAGAVHRYAAAGKQRSAYEYGSAFARAADARTPAGRTVFVSGTAAIDESGASCFVGDAKGQIGMTMRNVLAVLRDTRVTPSDVVQGIAYCKTEKVAEEFRHTWEREFGWPWVLVIGDVCRDELLFEAEVTAVEQGK